MPQEAVAALDFGGRWCRMPSMRALPSLRIALVLLLLGCSGPWLQAEDPVGPAEAPTPAEGTVYKVTDLEALKPLVGQTVTVEGTVVEAGTSGSGTVRYLNFTKPFWKSLALIFFSSSTKVPMDTLDEYLNKHIKATGKLSEHNTKLQIVIENAEQIEVLPGAEPPVEAETPAAE